VHYQFLWYAHYLFYCTLHCQQHELQFVYDDKQERQCGTCYTRVYISSAIPQT
jgi:hypothetical protein